MNTDPGAGPAAPQSAVELPGPPVIRAVVCAGGIETSYLRAGRGAPVLLLHGSQGGAASWEPVFGSLSPHFRLIVPEVPGPQEAGPGADRVAELSAWLRDFLDGLGVHRVSLVGNREGGALAVRFALAEPERAERLVLVGVEGMLDRGSGSSFQQQLQQLERPTLIVRGDAGAFSARRQAEAAGPVQVQFLPAAGPYPLEDQLLALSGAMLQFLGSINSAAAVIPAVAGGQGGE